MSSTRSARSAPRTGRAAHLGSRAGWRAGSLLAASAVLTVIVAACAVPDTHYGGPAGLAQRQTPDPVYPAGSTGDGGPGATDTICNGGPPIGDMNCAVKWSVDIYPKLVKSTGNWKCADAQCHAEGPSGNAPYPPAISDTDASRAWAALVNYKLANKRYIDPCTKTAEDSAITCNLPTPAGCPPQMPETTFGNGAKSAVNDELTTVQTWLQCGAPNN